MKPKLSVLRHLSTALGMLADRMNYGAEKYDVEGVQKREAKEWMDKALRHALEVEFDDTGSLSPSSTQHAVASAFNFLALVNEYGYQKEEGDGFAQEKLIADDGTVSVPSSRNTSWLMGDWDASNKGS